MKVKCKTISPKLVTELRCERRETRAILKASPGLGSEEFMFAKL